MRALLSKAPGAPETLVLEDVPAPTPGPGEAVVAVKACGVNFPDVLLVQDLYQYRPARPFAPGGEIAGVVATVGEGVTRVKPGDRVLAASYWGGMVEQMILPEIGLVPIPDAMPFDEAAAFITTFGTAFHGLKDRAGLQPGQTLLVLGAAGGVGLAAVALGRAMGARVIAAASSQDKVDLCLEHGADAGLVYPRGALDRDAQKTLAQQFKAAAGPDGAHVIFDVVGGDYAEPALRSIAWGGKYLVVGFTAGAIPRPPLNLVLLKGCDVAGVFWGDWVTRNPDLHQESARELLTLYEAGKIRPLVSERYPLERGADAIVRLASRQAMGKIVVTVG